MARRVGRREVLGATAAALIGGVLEGCTAGLPRETRRSTPASRLELPPLRADVDRITAITVCTRPFRAQGPRLELERLGDKTVVHNYGHGGSGWSLSWGSSAIATDMVLAGGARDIAVLGCGALGLTSALLLQRAGARVRIYAKDLPPNVRSSLATGVWSPDSRICLQEHATPAFKQQWERMARHSWQTYQTLLGLSGQPVEYFEHYDVLDGPAGPPHESLPDERPPFAKLQHELIPDIGAHSREYPPGTHPFGARWLRGAPWLMFNLPALTRMLLSDFLAFGGRIEITEFKSPAELSALPEKTLVNATGYGARALFGDESLVPVRGQLAHLIPEPQVHYGVLYRDVNFVPRRDGLVFQVIGANDYYGVGDATTVPDRAEAELAVRTITALYS
jgi:glycine/D-amino acid oxidase-like deaminating enzyme